MTTAIDVDQGAQQGGDQDHISTKAKRDLAAMEGKEEGEGENAKKKEKVDDERKAPTPSKSYNSDDADISLISSDNVLFKVHSYHLMAGSSVLRSILSMPNSAAQRDPIHLSDDVLETESVLKYLLDIVYKIDMSVVTNTQAFAVLALAEKWDFDHARELIGRELQLHDNNRKVHQFQLSIELKKPKLIAGWIGHFGDTTWGSDQPGSTPGGLFERYRRVRHVYEEPAQGLLDEEFVKGGRVMEPGTWKYGNYLTWKYGNYLLTSPTVLWALARATHVGTITPAKIDPKKVAKEFERLLTMAYEPKKDTVEKEEKSGSGKEEGGSVEEED